MNEVENDLGKRIKNLERSTIILYFILVAVVVFITIFLVSSITTEETTEITISKTFTMGITTFVRSEEGTTYQIISPSEFGKLMEGHKYLVKTNHPFLFEPTILSVEREIK
ncbi:MAG: hypothetical protein PHC68_18770 [Syntrophorhabdaceae bacterium]|nr:hypothetical protein [Syntrophorhabdaceae bacterium]